ncbi:hypothetical protein BSL78_16434 [Apostichopus japonicus]|uniref:Integrase catalytic domain-containing protein n=1 Tax=Stichopus japonicus TaxID=307972 RepID=A0A2G8KFC7_STIJA|nr:hypothetical protein BSL78_16434 [Apostichopus japonicus]
MPETVSKGRISKVPLGRMPLIDTPFHRVAIDLVGPLAPVSDRGNRYVLTLVDYATRFPEAVALPSIETERVAEALLEIFTRVGFPKEILTDMGSQFTSDLMREISRVLQIKQLTTTPYHPICNGLVEKFNAGSVLEEQSGSCAIIEENNSETDKFIIVLPPSKSKECFRDVNVNSELCENKAKEVSLVLSEFRDVLTDTPGRTNLLEYTLPLVTDEVVRSRPYPIPLSTQKVIEEEIEYMLETDVIERSYSPYASPIVLVRKKDGSNRFCVDFRKLNKVALFDPEPIPSVEDLMAKVSKGKYFTKIDLSKGYWQIPVAVEERKKLAFVTHQGMYQFRVMPFGVVNASAVFTRMMRRLLMGCKTLLTTSTIY